MTIHYTLPEPHDDSDKNPFYSRDLNFPSDTMNVAEIRLISRYPETGYVINKQSDVIVRVLEGATLLQCDGEEVELPAGATVLVQAGKKYFWEPRGSTVLLIVGSPPWTKEQQSQVA